MKEGEIILVVLFVLFAIWLEGRELHKCHQFSGERDQMVCVR